jgi:hypothetical protein
VVARGVATPLGKLTLWRLTLFRKIFGLSFRGSRFENQYHPDPVAAHGDFEEWTYKEAWHLMLGEEAPVLA